MACKMCGERGKTWSGDDPVCGFEPGQSFDKNWSCATVGAIRDICDEDELPPGVTYQYCEDQKYATIKIDHIDGVGDALALWVTWYKNRGRTDSMWLLFCDAPPRQPTEAECLAIIAAYR